MDDQEDGWTDFPLGIVSALAMVGLSVVFLIVMLRFFWIE